MSGALCVILAGAAFEARAVPSEVLKSAATPTITTDPMTVNISGGSGDYSFLGEKLSGGNITATSPTSQTSQFQSVLIAPGEQRDAVFRWRVIDNSTGAIVYTPNISVTIIRDPL